MEYPRALLNRVSDFGGELLRMVQTRLEMLGIDAQIERDALLGRVRLGMFAAVAGTLSGVSATLWIAVAAPPTMRGTLLGVLTFLWLAIALTVALLARSADQRSVKPLFGGVVAQLERDRTTLAASVSVVEAEVGRESAGRARPVT